MKRFQKFIALISRHFRAYWALGLFIYFSLVALSFENMSRPMLAQILGLIFILCGAVAWVVNDYVADSERKIKTKLEEISDLLEPYDGMKLSEMPAEVQMEVRRRLGWAPKNLQATSAKSKVLPEGTESDVPQNLPEA